MTTTDTLTTDPTDNPSDAPAAPARQRWLLGRYDYPVSHRIFEVAVVATFAGFAATFGRRVVAALADGWRWWSVLTLAVVVTLAYALADLLSGLVHFAFDNLGSPETPVIGQKFVKPFRDHHADPAAMTHGDLIAVNGDNVFASLLILLPAWFALDVAEHAYGGAFLLALLAGIIATNQIHKWCHTSSVPAWVRTAQQRGLILSPRHHAVHHRAPHQRHYCITWGRLDRIVDRIGARATRGRPPVV